MNRVIIAILIISTAIGFCSWEQYEVNSFCKSVDKYCQSENPTEAATKIIELWNKKNNTLYAFSQHDLLEHLAENIEQLNSKKDKEKIKNALTEVRAQNNVYYQNHKMTFSNIF